MRCVIIDDNDEFLASARRLLVSQKVDVVGEARSAAAGLRLVEALAPDVVLIDVQLGDEDGLVVARSVLSHCPEVSVILISTHAEEDVVDLTTDAGVAGFLSKAALSAASIRALLR